MASLTLGNDCVYLGWGSKVCLVGKTDMDSIDITAVPKKAGFVSGKKLGSTTTADISMSDASLISSESSAVAPAKDSAMHGAAISTVSKSGMDDSLKKDIRIEDLVYSPTNDALVVATSDKFVRVIGPMTAGDGSSSSHCSEWTVEIDRQFKKSICKLAISGDIVAVADRFGDVYFCNVLSLSSRKTLGHLSTISHCVFDAKREFFLSCDRDFKCRVSRFPAHFIIESFLFGHTKAVTSVCLVASDQLAVTGCMDSKLRVFRHPTGEPVAAAINVRNLVDDSDASPKLTSARSKPTFAVKRICHCPIDASNEFIAVSVSDLNGILFFRVDATQSNALVFEGSFLFLKRSESAVALAFDVERRTLVCLSRCNITDIPWLRHFSLSVASGRMASEVSVTIVPANGICKSLRIDEVVDIAFQRRKSDMLDLSLELKESFRFLARDWGITDSPFAFKRKTPESTDGCEDEGAEVAVGSPPTKKTKVAADSQ